LQLFPLLSYVPPTVSARKQPPDNRQFRVGDHVIVSLSSGRVEEATVKAVIQQDNETRLIVDYGFDETATVSLWQVRRE
jgi:hypothetical protein